MRNVSQWNAKTDSSCFCCNTGSITIGTSGGSKMSNPFQPSLLGGNEAVKATDLLRLASRQDRPPPPAHLAKMTNEAKFSHKSGCYGITSSLCTGPLCQTSEHVVGSGPVDTLAVTKTNAWVCCCQKSVETLGTTIDNLGLFVAESPVGMCGFTGPKPDFGSCQCSCTESAAFVVVGDKDSPITVNTKTGDAAIITADVLSRAISNPALGAEEKLRSFESKHGCYGKRGDIVITNQRVEYTGFKHPNFCCELLVKGVPNICCCLFQTNTKYTIPLEKVTDVTVANGSPCKAIGDAMEGVNWACGKCCWSCCTGSYLAALLWLVITLLEVVYCVLSPVIACICFPWRQAEVRIGGQAGSIDITIAAPMDSGGLKTRELAVDIVNVVRKAQEKNLANCTTALSGRSK